MSSNNFNHPLPVGFRIISIEGECDEGDNGTRQTGPNAVGEIISVVKYNGRQGYSYGIEFKPSGVWVNIDQGDSIDDPAKYRPAPHRVVVQTQALAKSFQERASALGYGNGKKAGAAAMDYFCGAAVMAGLVGDTELHDHLTRIIVMIISVRGMFGVNELAAKLD